MENFIEKNLIFITKDPIFFVQQNRILTDLKNRIIFNEKIRFFATKK